MVEYHVYELELEDEEMSNYMAICEYGSYPDLSKAIELAKNTILWRDSMLNEDRDMPIPVYVEPISEWTYYVGIFNDKHEFIPKFEVSEG